MWHASAENQERNQSDWQRFWPYDMQTCRCVYERPHNDDQHTTNIKGSAKPHPLHFCWQCDLMLAHFAT